MSATITATGTFTNLDGVIANSTQRLSNAPGGPIPQNAVFNNPTVEEYNLDSLKTQDGVIYPELRDFIQLVATAYNLPFWVGASLVQTLLRAFMQTQRDITMLGDDHGPRIFIP